MILFIFGEVGENDICIHKTEAHNYMTNSLAIRGKSTVLKILLWEVLRLNPLIIRVTNCSNTVLFKYDNKSIVYEIETI